MEASPGRKSNPVSFIPLLLLYHFSSFTFILPPLCSYPSCFKLEDETVETLFTRAPGCYSHPAKGEPSRTASTCETCGFPPATEMYVANNRANSRAGRDQQISLNDSLYLS